LLTGAGLTAVANANTEEIVADPAMFSSGLLVTRDHEELGVATHLGVAPRFERTPAVPGRPVEPQGRSTDTILAEHGYSPAEIALLHAAGALG
jgi:crotonobetainyl-CoA:carnitine CoA-transferase CaiB-like acyl-CoA transferase